MPSKLQEHDYTNIEVWARELQVGDKEHEQEFFKTLAIYIKPILLGKLGTLDEDTLSDLSSNTISSIWKNLQTWDETKGAFLTWVAGIVHNKAVDYVRQYNRDIRRNTDLALDDITGGSEPKTRSEETFERVLQGEQSKRVLVELLKNIDQLDRTIYLLRINYDLSFIELTEIVQGAGHELTVKAVEQRFYRTRNKLKDVLETLT